MELPFVVQVVWRNGSIICGMRDRGRRLSQPARSEVAGLSEELTVYVEEAVLRANTMSQGYKLNEPVEMILKGVGECRPEILRDDEPVQDSDLNGAEDRGELFVETDHAVGAVELLRPVDEVVVVKNVLYVGLIGVAIQETLDKVAPKGPGELVELIAHAESESHGHGGRDDD